MWLSFFRIELFVEGGSFQRALTTAFKLFLFQRALGFAEAPPRSRNDRRAAIIIASIFVAA